MTSIAITGAAGRMGSRLIALAKQDGTFEVVGAIERPDHPQQSRDAGEVAGVGAIGTPITYDLKPTPQVLIDFTTPASMRHWLKTCRDRGIAMVIGTTGLQDQDFAAIDRAAADIAILQAPNMSLGVNVLFKIAGEVARMLGEDYDIEIVEGHHRFKKDAPSGTAYGLADAILKATNKARDALLFDRHGDESTRKRGEIGMHSLRIGDEVGRHTAYFAALGERLELTHVATNRDTFVHGALKAAKWLSNQKPGRYAIADMLGLSVLQ
ncbi:MAG TPA: 4-hydroxy-tetrahydrodipicolinate reductase [Tepidisphaeraceae bacterium]|nr:4-hydroxy-tetrahydrodipicolinate reductase [Tepidisphaeraceae bacterium]